MLKLVMLAGLMLLIVIVAGAARLMPHGTAAETATPQQVYFHLQNDENRRPEPAAVSRRSGLSQKQSVRLIVHPTCVISRPQTWKG
jgi:hypothetical protein